MLSQIKKVLEDKLLDDETREISFTFTVPSILDMEKQQFGVMLPNMNFYFQILFFLLFQTFIAACIAIPLYYLFIIPQNKKQISNNTLTTSYLIGFGLILPFILYEPIWMIHYFDVRSLAIKMLILSLPISGALRSMEVIFGYSPPAAKKDIKIFILYFSCLMGLSFGEKNLENPRKLSTKYFSQQLMKLSRGYILIVPLLSFLNANKYIVFQTGFEVDSSDHTLWDLLSWKHLVNNYANALLLSISLYQSTLGVGIIYNLLYRYELIEVVQNPMFESKSPTDFWGRRWNILIHSLLKNGTYKPVRKYYGRSVAVLATFLVSGLLHEYVNIVLLSEVRDSIEWKNMIFFLWNGMIIYSESKIGHWSIFQWMSRTLPNIFITFLVILTALPLGHLFTGEYIAGGYFDHVTVANPLIVKLQ